MALHGAWPMSVKGMGGRGMGPVGVMGHKHAMLYHVRAAHTSQFRHVQTNL